ncbi:hypothetical protein NBRC116601_32630 [Cognatishimia sp. WU-CL00825]|uniref:spondin domain-containing protein n=1 Tax=Cognatishimia sp. WU-CL00825 TaxID=3127658 RepID=UPI00310A1178
MNTELRISVHNTSETGGTAFTPVFSAFHDNSFDVYNLGQAASAGLEALAEDGNNGIIAAELLSADGDAQFVNVAGARGPIAAGELAATTILVDGVSNGYLGLASMLLPSNDAFFGTAEGVQLFDSNGKFLGAKSIAFDGNSVRDAGTEENTEQDAAFINQTGPNTGITENGVVTVHPGFNGSAGNPGGDQIILGGTNAFGDTIDPSAADFTLPGAQIANVHINTVARTAGTDQGETLDGGRADDVIDAGAGDDLILGRSGWDVLNGDAGADTIRGGNGDDLIDGGADDDFLFGGNGNDAINGGTGNDRVSGGAGNDQVSGGANNDVVLGGQGNDVISGGSGTDVLIGGAGNDIFVFATGDDRAVIRDFDSSGDDRIAIDIAGFDSFADVLDVATQTRKGVEIDFGNGDSAVLLGVDIDDLGANDFLF